MTAACRRVPLLTTLLLPLVATVAVLVLTVLSARDASHTEWGRFVGLVLLGLLAYGLIARADPARSGHASAVVVLPAAVVLLPLDLALSVALVLSVPRLILSPHMLVRQRALEVGTEIGAAIASALTAAAVYRLAATFANSEGAWALTALTACVTFVAVSHALRLVADRAEGDDSRTVVPPLGMPTELLLATLGAALAAVCLTSPWLVPFALAPLLLLPRWFGIPLLEQQARRDPKTGLFNARHFELAVVSELERATAARTPLTVLVADLDLLRAINNTHGHLAGDAVLRGVADILRAEVRIGDVPARFGGEEFAVLLPGTSRPEAFEIAERLRRTVAEARFASGPAEAEIGVTVSIGLASYPEDGSSAVLLIHRADLAVYRAKLQGRNRVVANGEHSIPPAITTPGPLQLVASSSHEASELDHRRSVRLPWLVAVAEPRLPLAAAIAGAAVASFTLLLLHRASVVTAAVGVATCVTAIFMLRKAARARTDRESAAAAHERAERLRQGADGLSALNRSLESANRLLRDRSSAAMETLSAAVDARDSHMAGHSRRVQRLSLSLGQELGFSDSELEVLRHAARFHDVGKLAVPEAILLKSGELGDLDWEVVRRHPEEGARLIDHLGFLEDALPAIRHHHERYDGTGYPTGLTGEDIPLGARIIHLADALDAMLTARPYRPALAPLEAIEQVRTGSGTQFCPRCVEALDRLMLVELKRGADVPRELLAS
jgi:diguanylate cyclase (GGDEF)-like protein